MERAERRKSGRFRTKRPAEAARFHLQINPPFGYLPPYMKNSEHALWHTERFALIPTTYWIDDAHEPKGPDIDDVFGDRRGPAGGMRAVA